MQALLKVLLLLVIQLPLNTVGEAGLLKGLPANQSTESAQEVLDDPFGPSNLYAIHHQTESPAEIINRVPQPHSTTERKIEPYGSSVPESAIERWLIFYIRFGDLIEPGLPIHKLLFPFHFFW